MIPLNTSMITCTTHMMQEVVGNIIVYQTQPLKLEMQEPNRQFNQESQIVIIKQKEDHLSLETFQVERIVTFDITRIAQCRTSEGQITTRTLIVQSEFCEKNNLTKI